MPDDRSQFGDYLRAAIKQAGLTQYAFYQGAGIAKPYFYDILAGKVKPPPPETQQKMMEQLHLSDLERLKFLDIAAAGRHEVPADIARLINEHPEAMSRIREAINQAITEETEKRTQHGSD